MDKKFSDKYKKTKRPNGTKNINTSQGSKDDLLKLKKELEQKKRLLEKRLLEIEKGKQVEESKPAKVEIKKPHLDDTRGRGSSNKSATKKIKFEDKESLNQKPRVKIKKNLADSSKQVSRDAGLEKLKREKAVKLDLLLEQEKKQNDKVKISNKYRKRPIEDSAYDDDKNDKPRLRVKSNAIHPANEKKEQVEAGISEGKNVIKTTKADNKLFENTPNVIITNRLDDGQSDFRFSDIVDGRSSVNDGEIELFNELDETNELEEHEEKHRVKISETKDDYKAFGDDVEGEYGSKLVLDNHQTGKLISREEHKAIDNNDNTGSSVYNMNLEVKSLVGDNKDKNLLPSTSVNTKSRRIFRHELKYYITWADYKMLSKSLNCLLHHDNNADPVTGDYYIRSLYFDDFKNSALTEKLSGIENRKKYRIRIYGLKDNLIRVERKNKTKDYISKDNLTLSRKEYDSVIAGDIEFLLNKDNQMAKDFYFEIKTKKLEPCVIVDYVREAYVHPIKNLRITFDKMVKSGRYDTSIFKQDVSLASVLPPGQVVLEVKFEKGLPDYIIGVLNTISACNRSAISKYALCRKYES